MVKTKSPQKSSAHRTGPAVVMAEAARIATDAGPRHVSEVAALAPMKRMSMRLNRKLSDSLGMEYGLGSGAGY